MDEHGGKEDMVPDDSAVSKSERPSVLNRLKEAKEKVEKASVDNLFEKFEIIL